MKTPPLLIDCNDAITWLNQIKANTMMSVSEAMQRANHNGLMIKRINPASTQWIVTLVEWTREQCHKFRYITDDLEDAVIEGAKMRRDAAKYV